MLIFSSLSHPNVSDLKGRFTYNRHHDLETVMQYQEGEPAGYFNLLSGESLKKYVGTVTQFALFVRRWDLAMNLLLMEPMPREISALHQLFLVLFSPTPSQDRDSSVVAQFLKLKSIRERGFAPYQDLKQCCAALIYLARLVVLKELSTTQQDQRSQILKMIRYK